MRLTVLGKSPSWPDAGGACSGYLLENDGRAALIDCGNGAFGKLRLHRDYREIETVAISHLHGDHVLDLVPFSYALTLGPGSGEREAKPRLLAPAAAPDFFRRVVGAWGSETLIESAFEIGEYDPGDVLDLAGVPAMAHRVHHIGPTHAFELSGAGGGRIVFGADGRYSDELIAAARGAAVLIAEATLPEPEDKPLGERVHMSAAEAGALAQEAGAGRLVLTHISDELDGGRSLAAAREAFGGPVEIAREGAAYEV